MSEKQPKLKFEEEKERTATRSPPKKSKVEQSVPKKHKLKQDADKAAEKSQHLRFGKAEITPDEASRMTKQQKRAMYAAAAARSAVHREVDQYEDDNVGTQALSEGEKAAETTHDISKSRYARKLKKKAKMQGKKGARTAKSSVQKPPAAQDAGASSTGEGSSNWLSRWKQRQEIRKSHYAAAHSGTAAQTAGGKAVSNGTTAAKSGMEQVIDKGKSVVSTAVNGIANFAKSNAHVLLIVGVFLLLLLLVMSAFSSCSILFSGTTQVSGQTIYTAEDRDIRGAETDYKKLEKELDKKIKRTPTDHPGYDEYRYHLDAIEHDPWQLTSFLTTLYDDYTRSEVQAKLKETFAKQYKLTTWVEVQTRYRTVVIERTQELSNSSFECSEDETSPLMQKYMEATTIVDTYHETKSSFAWIGEIEDERLLTALEHLKKEDLEIITLYAYEGYSVVELSKVYRIAHQNISKRIARITKFLKNFDFEGAK